MPKSRFTTTIGDNFLARQAPASALHHLYLGLALTVKLGQDTKRAAILASLGDARIELGDYAEAMCYYEEALTIQREKKLPHQEAGSLLRIAGTHLVLDQLDKASDYAFAALSLFREIGNRQEEAFALHAVSRIKTREGRLDQALAANEKALEILESLRAKIMGRHLRASFFSSIHEIYAFRLDLLMDLAEKEPGRHHEITAFQVGERAKARTLLDLLGQNPSAIKSETEHALFLERQRIQNELSGKIDYRLRLGLDEDRGSIDETDSEIEELVAEFRNIEDQIRSRDPHYAFWSQPQPVTHVDIQHELLDDQTVLLAYGQGVRFSYLWLITRDRIEARRLAPREHVEAKARDAYNLLKARNEQIPFETLAEKRKRIADADKDWPRIARILSKMLLDPVWDRIQGKRLVVVADGFLQFLPFGALPVPSQHHANPDPIILHNNVVSAPSGSVLLAFEPRGKNKDPRAETARAFRGSRLPNGG